MYFFMIVYKSAVSYQVKKYSRGWIGAPAKGIGRESGARVQIPPSSPHYSARAETTILLWWCSG